MRKKVVVEKVGEYSGHKGSIFAISPGLNPMELLSSGDDGVVAKWKLDSRENEGEGIFRTEHGIYSILSIPKQGFFVAGGSQGSVYFIEEKSKKVIRLLRNSPNPVYNLYYDAQNFVIWILQGNGFLSVVDVKRLETLFHKQISPGNLRGICASQREDKVYIGTSDHRILVCSKENYKTLRAWKAHENSVFTLAMHPNGAYIVSGGRDAHLKFWESRIPNDLMEKIAAHNFTVNDIIFSPDGDYFVTASRDKTLKVWDAYTFELLKVIDNKRNEGHTHSVNRLKWIQRDNTIISCSDDRRIIQWKLQLTG
ncbi:MAG: hypothetical protein AAF694_01230 [Bacteroidota bacterium]